jgi:hypothetical protein
VLPRTTVPDLLPADVLLPRGALFLRVRWINLVRLLFDPRLLERRL